MCNHQSCGSQRFKIQMLPYILKGLETLLIVVDCNFYPNFLNSLLVGRFCISSSKSLSKQLHFLLLGNCPINAFTEIVLEVALPTRVLVYQTE